MAKKLILATKKPMRVENLTALLEHLAGWKTEKGETLIWRKTLRLSHAAGLALYAKRPIEQRDVTPPTRGTWVVNIPGVPAEKGHTTGPRAEATIEAFEEGQLSIEFWDGTNSALPPIGAAFEEFSQYVLANLPGEPQEQAAAAPAGMTEERRKRAELFLKIKRETPTLSQVAVAGRARLMPGFEDVTDDDVRNDYRAMGWEWERANQIR